MNTKTKRILGIVILILLASSKFRKLVGNDNIRPIQYVFILTIGVLFGFLIYEFVAIVKEKMKA